MKKKYIIPIVIVLLIIIAFFAVQSYASKFAEKKIDQSLAKVSSYADINYKDVSVDLVTRSIHLSDITVSPKDSNEKFNINELVINKIDTKSDIPSYLSVSVKGIDINLEEVYGGMDFLSELGFDKSASANFDLDYTFDKNNKILNIDKLNMDLESIGELGISISIGGIELDSTSVYSIMLTYPNILLYNSKIIYKDDSFIENMMKLGADSSGMNLSDFQDFIIENLDSYSGMFDDKTMQNLADEIKSFIRDPKELSISFSPENPVQLADLINVRDPMEFVDLLNVKIDSN